MSKWKEYDLGDVAEIVCGATPSTSKQEYWSDEINWVTAKDISEGNGYKISETERKISRLGLESCSTVLLPPFSTVLIARGATMGKSAMISSPMALNQTCYALVGKTSSIDSFFLFYSIKSLLHYFEGIAHGAIFNTVIGSSLRETSINLPPLPEQRAIAGVLSSLDDKIDLLHRQNKTLEGITSALWRKMFIEDADPNWKKGTLGDMADNIRANVCVAELNNYEHYVGLEHIQKKHFALYDWGNTSELESNKSCFRNRDILFGKLRAYFHKVCFAPVDGVCSTDILVIRPKMPEFHTLCLLWFFSEDVVDYSDASSGGTRMPRTNWDTLASYEILIPPSESVARFNHDVLPMIDRIEHNIFSIRTLSRLRDTLLPKLMSGEVRVRL